MFDRNEKEKENVIEIWKVTERKCGRKTSVHRDKKGICKEILSRKTEIKLNTKRNIKKFKQFGINKNEIKSRKQTGIVAEKQFHKENRINDWFRDSGVLKFQCNNHSGWLLC